MIIKINKKGVFVTPEKGEEKITKEEHLWILDFYRDIYGKRIGTNGTEILWNGIKIKLTRKQVVEMIKIRIIFNMTDDEIINEYATEEELKII